MFNDDPAYSESYHWSDRTRQLIGDEAFMRLRRSSVLVVGLGGVGGYAAEMLVRTGIGNLTLVDSDCVDVTNINRQIIATTRTIGMPKTILFAERFHSIDSEATINAIEEYVTAENVPHLLAHGFDYVLDCIDTVAPKIALITEAMELNIPIISSMGAGGRMDPTKVGYFDIWETREDGLARAVRQRLKRMSIKRNLKVVASTEAPSRDALLEVGAANKRTSYGTVAAIPALFGIYMAQYVINKLIRSDK